MNWDLVVTAAEFREHSKAIAAMQKALAKLDPAQLTARIAAATEAADDAARRAEARLAIKLAQLKAIPKEPTLPPPLLYYGAGGPYAGDDKGATATSADYAQVAIEWAEHMPDTIPANILAVTGVSGNHWSSRWWAGEAASIVSSVGTVRVFAEALMVTGGGGIPALSHAPNGPVLLVINGVAFLPVGAQPPFSVSGSTISWTSPIYALPPGTEIAVWYPYAP